MKTYLCTYTVYNRDMKEYKGSFTISSELEAEAYIKCHKMIKDQWGSDVMITFTLKESGE